MTSRHPNYFTQWKKKSIHLKCVDWFKQKTYNSCNDNLLLILGEVEGKQKGVTIGEILNILHPSQAEF